MKTGIELIKEERERQIAAEGWTPEHDDEHYLGEMAIAAACYALMSTFRINLEQKNILAFVEKFWPWDVKWWKPKSQRKDLIRAGALIAAELDRLGRM